MIVFDYEIESGFIVPFDKLQRSLPSIDKDAHQWRVQSTLQVRDHHAYAAIDYTNPELADMPNSLCYLFPVLDDGFGTKDPMVCLHPTAGIPVIQGLYFEGPELKRDLLEDWGRFWEPLRGALTSRS